MTQALRGVLEGVLEDLGSVLVAYSGGVDSTYLAWAAHQTLGPRSLAVIADSASLPRSELEDALDVSFPVDIVRTDELTRSEYVANAPDRCFHCKEALFDQLFPLAEEKGFAHVALGTVTDDLGDVRPGLASAKQRGAKQPLVEAGLSKQDVRRLAKEAGLRVWDKPQAACLSSRIPHGTPVTLDTLRKVERAEEAMKGLGFRVVRVRHFDDTARIEVGIDEVERASALQEEIAELVGYERFTIAAYKQGGARLPIIN